MVVAAAGVVVAIIDAVIIARAKIVDAAVMNYLLLFFLMRCISMPSTNTMDKRLLFLIGQNQKQSLSSGIYLR